MRPAVHPVGRFRPGPAGSGTQELKISCARPKPSPAARATSPGSALSSASREPNAARSCRLRFLPIPGTFSRTEVTRSPDRRCLWKVVAKRWASSRTAWRTRSASESSGKHQRLASPGQEHLLVLLGQSDHRHLEDLQGPEHLHGGSQLAFAPVDQDQVGQPAVLDR